MYEKLMIKNWNNQKIYKKKLDINYIESWREFANQFFIKLIIFFGIINIIIFWSNKYIWL